MRPAAQIPAAGDPLPAPEAGCARVVTQAAQSLPRAAQARLSAADSEAEQRLRAVVDAAPDGLVIVDQNGVIVLVNARAQEMFGSSGAELLGSAIEVLMPPEARERHRAHMKDYVREPRMRTMAEQLELTGLRRDGTTFPVEVTLSPVQTDDGLLVASAIRDVTSRRAAQHEIARLAAIVESSQDAITSSALDGSITSWNPAAEALYGYSQAEALGRSITMLFPGEEEAREMAGIIQRVAADELVGQIETRRRTKDGRILDVAIVVSPIRDSHGRVVGASTIGRDVTERKRDLAALAAAEARFRAAFENAPIGVAIVGMRGDERERVLQANPAMAGLLGWQPGALDGVPISTFSHPDDEALTEAAFTRLDRGLPTQMEKRFLHRNGSDVWGLVTTTPIPGEGGAPATRAITQVLDITDRKQFEWRLQYLADHDKLTGLFNRQRFEAELERVVEESHRYNRFGALLILDLDGFKSVNDRFGHAAGDELVRRVAAVMRLSIRETDILARIGGDEFALILQECDQGDAEMVAGNLLAAVRQRGMIVADGVPARVTTSVGITTFDGSDELSAAELVVEADIAMYDAKAGGKDRFAVYDRSENRRAVVSKRHSWLDRLKRALEEDRFVMHAQPIVGICANGIRRYELLLRLPDHDGQLIPPRAFLYNAERFGLMGQIDRWVLRRAVELLHAHAAAGNDISLAVNLSGATMDDLSLGADLAELLRRSPVPEGRLVIEVTETAAIVNMERARELARELRALGCRFALDDFGAGFASFYYLKHLEFDYLKIDGEFIKRLTTNRTDQLVVRCVVEIAAGLGTETIAEFIGDDATVDLLRELGVSYGQGFHLGRPGALEDELPSLLRASAG